MKKFLVLLCVFMLNCGCLFTPQRDNSRFYALGLNGKRGEEKCALDGDCCCVVRLNISGIPAYIDVAQLTKIRNGCEIVRSEIHRWAEPVKCSITRSLSDHLSEVLGRGGCTLVSSEFGVTKNCAYEICVEFTNFIFDESDRNLFLAANILIFKRGELTAICNYSNRFPVVSDEYGKIVGSMDCGLGALADFVARCIGIGDIGQRIHNSRGCNMPPDCAVEICDDPRKQVENCPMVDEFPRVINIFARGEVYVIVDSADGEHRYFSGRLFSGTSIDVKCDAPYRVISTNDTLIDVNDVK